MSNQLDEEFTVITKQEEDNAPSLKKSFLDMFNILNTSILDIVYSLGAVTNRVSLCEERLVKKHNDLYNHVEHEIKKIELEHTKLDIILEKLNSIEKKYIIDYNTLHQKYEILQTEHDSLKAELKKHLNSDVRTMNYFIRNKTPIGHIKIKSDPSSLL